MTTKAQLNRIRILIEELEKLRKEHGRKVKFAMGVWCDLEDKSLREAVRNPCGTYACLAGKAGLIPRIRRMGFKCFDDDFGVDFKYKSHSGTSAIEKFFGKEIMRSVFTRYAMTIPTLFQGILALKRFVAARE